MNYPLKDFLVVNTKLIEPLIYKKYPNCVSYPIISDKEGERWICEFKTGFVLPPHSHLGRYEWYVLSGKFRFTNPESGKSVILNEGDYYCNPPNIPHNEECLKDGRVLWIYNADDIGEDLS